ncbi:bifunctional 4-hydroxy-2-oxoglutarate aldolase/2-dehydro-3-deoxy-phosphogluconate aldolase [Pseudidiomarina insulisalsae]|uniref:2-dehydro-3-deoxy-phosphogluconate aldolase n=1 Tax=Pseudidiomarina insulisalsae TaxID=575789 RepID=A0A432YMS0_9GAMM|nr:bifunctional 4-hydroxy-2-oxoglutarate aldolase/2-dehydro-3-deoxy-phosphogluconate aldolase [Pseudidiomarina insulisalsae]RUO62233.1 keto-deoxy-phosphogluconate aldolase [Pseudidiomarina insulisalsae]
MSFSHWQLAPADLFKLTPVIPVMVIERLEDALPMGEALLAAGIPMLEVTLRTPVALAAIERLRERLPQAIVGAGTVTNEKELIAAKAAGAQFAISPGITTQLLEAGRRSDVPLIPGVATVSELMLAKEMGYTHLKFFPAEAAGGTAMLKSMAGPFAEIRFCPTGGIGPDNFRDYLALPNVMCVGGSWILPKAAVEAGDWAKVQEIAAAAVSAAK